MAKKESAETTAKRRRLIKKMMLEEGITNREEIRRRLNTEFGFPFYNRNTIYNDIKHLANLSNSEIEKFEIDILSVYKRMIRNQLEDIENCDDPKERTSMRRALSQLMKDQHAVASSMSINQPNAPKEKRDRALAPSRIIFGDDDL